MQPLSLIKLGQIKVQTVPISFPVSRMSLAGSTFSVGGHKPIEMHGRRDSFPVAFDHPWLVAAL